MRRLTLLLSLPAMLLGAEPLLQEMSLTTPDENVLSGTLTVPEGRGKFPAVILVHSFHTDRTSWAPLVEKLNARGLATLALDLRGHGKSGQPGNAIAATYLAASEVAGFDQIPSDLALAAAWLRKQKGIDGRHLGLAGANEGAFAVLLAASKVKPAVILTLSPSGADAFGQGAMDRMLASTTRAHASVMSFSGMGDTEVENNVAPLRPLYGSNIRTFEGSQRGFEYLAEYGDTMAVFFAEYLLHPHTGRGAQAPQQPTDMSGATVLTPTAPPAQP